MQPHGAIAMKCNKKDNIIKRVADNIAADLVANKGWAFTSKKDWKMNVRDVVVAKVEVVPEVAAEVPVVEKKKKPQGRQLAKKTGQN